jgi:2-polyprenyl-6-methoxyphenol hydroxylase-like FAD-dependent oxidoreductase
MVDVLIIGAGPAGSMSAALLASRGYEVLVLEKQRFPRFSIGESLLASTAELMHEAGMLEAVMACGFQYKNGAAFVRDDLYSELTSPTSFRRVSVHVPVLRAEFDQVLANEAARAERPSAMKWRSRGSMFPASAWSRRNPVMKSPRTGRGSCSTPAVSAARCRLLDLDRPSDFPNARRCSCT